MMSPGKAAYEQRKQKKKDDKMDRERTLEEHQRREAKADEVVDLVFDAVKAMLTGKAYFAIDPPGADSRKRVYFVMHRDT